MKQFCGTYNRSDASITGHTFGYLRDRMGSTVAVVDRNAKMVQTTGYYPSGTPYRVPASGIQTPVDSKTDELHIGNKWLGHSGMNMYDNTARMHDPLLMRFASPDPLYTKFGDFSPWSHCAADPLNHFDPDGLPSPEDYIGVPNVIHYVVGMKNNQIYIHNDRGIISSFDYKKFLKMFGVSPK